MVTRNLFSAIMSTTIFSLICALIFLILDGVDVSLTEAAVGAGISTILFLSTLKYTDIKIKNCNKTISPLIVLFLLLLLSLSYMVSDLPEYGKIKVSSESYVTKYYIANSKTEMGITYVVTSVLAGYRSFDTLGEVVVIFIAGISVLGRLFRGAGRAQLADHTVGVPAATGSRNIVRCAGRGGDLQRRSGATAGQRVLVPSAGGAVDRNFQVEAGTKGDHQLPALLQHLQE